MNKPYNPKGMANVQVAEGYGSPDSAQAPDAMLDITSLA